MATITDTRKIRDAIMLVLLFSGVAACDRCHAAAPVDHMMHKLVWLLNCLLL